MNKSHGTMALRLDWSNTVRFVAALGVAVALSRPADAATLTVTDGFAGFGVFDRSLVGPAGTGPFGPPATTFDRSFGISRFDPSLGILNSVDVSWQLKGGVEFGVFPHGPDFEGGGGSITGSSLLTLFGAIGTSSPISDFELILVSHEGSIAGPPGAFSSSTSSAAFSSAVSLSFTGAVDLAQFTGLNPISFETSLGYFYNGFVTDPGPNFGGRPTPGDRPDVDVSITYNFTPFPDDPERDTGAPGPTTDIPEPASLSLLGAGLLGLVWVRRRSQKPLHARVKPGRRLPALSAATWRGETRSQPT